MSVIGYCIDESLFSSALLLAFVYAMIILNSDNAQNRHTKG